MGKGTCARVLAVVLTAGAGTGFAGPRQQSDPPGTAAEVSRPFPGEQWQSVPDLAAAGWSVPSLDQAGEYAASLGNLAVMVVEDGLVVASWGDVKRTTLVQSIRKSFMNALYGSGVEAGDLWLDATLEELGIDDENPALSDEERQATVRDLLQSRSGVYHDAATTPSSHLQSRPPRGSHPPGTHWYYNNWDFNVLGTIYEQETGAEVFSTFAEEIAVPLGMEDFDAAECEKRREDVSIHPAHHFAMSARDMARFGLLYLRQGRWENREVVPSSWVAESTRAHSGDEREGYGYLWWIQHRIGGFAARGGDAQMILVVPERQLVFVTQIPRHEDRLPELSEIGQLLRMVLEAKSSGP